MTCHLWQQLLNDHLDGGDPAPLEEHLHTCGDCATTQADIRRLLDGLSLLTPPVGPVDLTDRLVTELAREARARRRLRWRRRVPALVGVAAAVLLLVLARFWWPAPPDPAPPAPVARAPEPLRDSVAQASTAMAALTTRTASATMDQTTTLLPLVQGAALEPLTVAPTPLDPPMQPLREASAGVSAGLSPVADSARRAVSLFLRDLPMGRDDPPSSDDKPG